MSRSVRTALAAASVAVVVGLAGCAPEAEPDLTTSQAESYRAQVVTIAERSAVGEYANALAELEAFEAEIDRAVAAGELDGEREQRIRDAIALVRADLEAAIAAAAEAEAEAEPTPDEGTAETPQDAPPPAGTGDSGTSGPGNSDKGKSKGKGKGNG